MPRVVSSSLADRSIRLVYAIILLVGTAYGASLAVTPLELTAMGYSKPQIGTLAIWFASGIIAASLPAGWLVRRLSARRTLVVCLLVYACATALFPLQRTYVTTGIVRALDGGSSVGVWIACETVLLARAGAAQKAFVMSLYGMSIAVGYVLGSGLARALVHVTDYPHVFFAASGIAVVTTLALVPRLDPVAERREEAHASEASTLALLWRTKTSCMATFSYGYFQSAVVLFLPLYLVEHKHVAEPETTLMPALFAGGMLLFSPLAARLGDTVGHLRVMAALASVGVLMILGFVFLSSWWAMAVAIFVAGATLASISPVSLALQGLVTHPADLSRANALYNACYAAGMLLGPPISSVIMTSRGGPAMLYHFAVLWGLFVLAAIVFLRDDPRAAGAR